jgi:hypothetical protein
MRRATIRIVKPLALRKAFTALEANGFLVPRDASNSRFAVAVRSMTLHTAAYAYVRDDRRGNAGVAADVWIAPLDYPDDGFDNLGVGFKAFIGRTFDEPDDRWFAAVRSRIVRYVNASNEIARAVESELQDPAWVTQRLKMYRLQVQAFHHARQVDGNLADHLMRRSKSIDRPSTAASLAHRLITEKPEYRLHEAVLPTMLLRQSYIEGLLSPNAPTV